MSGYGICAIPTRMTSEQDTDPLSPNNPRFVASPQNGQKEGRVRGCRQAAFVRMKTVPLRDATGSPDTPTNDVEAVVRTDFIQGGFSDRPRPGDPPAQNENPVATQPRRPESPARPA
jgi:hypothetical protein